MTGYGRGEATRTGWKFVVELSSVNRKQGEVSVHLPREFIELEPRIRDEVNAKLSRGRVTVVVAVHRSEGMTRRLIVDEGLVRQYHATFRKVARKLGVSEEVPLAAIFALPEVTRVEDAQVDVEAFWRAIRAALRQALKAMVAMREAEGEALLRDIVRRLEGLSRSIARIAATAPQVPARYREQLHARLRDAGVDFPLDDERILREMALFADKCDISEEITRLRSHLEQCASLLDSREPVGRTLDFLAQEMYREINTIGSKANDVGISQEAVRFKAELERVREQVQNIE